MACCARCCSNRPLNWFPCGRSHMFYRTFYRPPIRIKPCFIAIKQWRLEADRRPRFCDGCEETVATDRSSASASFDSSPIDRYPIGCLANLPTIDCFDHPTPSGGDHVHCLGDSNEKTRTEVKVLQKQQNPYRDTLKTSRNTFKRRERPQIYRRSGQFAFALQPALWTKF